MNIAERLTDLARLFPRAEAAVWDGGAMTFGELERDAGELAAGLARAGLARGARAALMVPPGPDFLALTFALFRLGAVPVMIDPGLGVKGMGQGLSEAEPDAFIGSEKAHLARILAGWPRARLLVTAGRRYFWDGQTLDGLRKLGRGSAPPPPADLEPGELSAVLFTSGSTGPAKGVAYTQSVFAAQIELLSEHFQIRPGEVSVATFPLFALFDVALGQTVVFPEMDYSRPASADPARLVAAISGRGASQLFGSPALLDRLGRHAAAHGLAFPTLKRVLSAGAPVAPRIIETFSRTLPAGVSIHTPYGATEALPVSCIESGEILGETAALTRSGRGICVGRPLPGVEVRILRISDDPIRAWSEGLAAPAGEVGEIAVSGPVATAGYFRRPEADALAKLRGPRGETIHRMGDLGYFDEKGRLWFCGRKSHRVATEEGTLYSVQSEGIFNAHPQVRRTALVGVRRLPVLCVEASPGADRETLRAELLALARAHASLRRIETILFHDSFPVDIRHNAKISREKLAAWAEARA